MSACPAAQVLSIPSYPTISRRTTAVLDILALMKALYLIAVVAAILVASAPRAQANDVILNFEVVDCEGR